MAEQVFVNCVAGGTRLMDHIHLQILDDTRKWWKARNYKGLVAHVPHTIVTPLEYEVVFSNPLYGGAGRDMYRQVVCELLA